MSQLHKASPTQIQIEELDCQINDADQTIDRLRQTSYSLMDQRQKLLVQMVREEKLLQGTKWKVEHCLGNIRLIPFSRVRSPELKKLDELLRTDYHCWVELQPDVRLRFDDSEISIEFESSKVIIPFITEHGLNVITLNIRDEIDKKKQEIAALEEILTKVGK